MRKRGIFVLIAIVIGEAFVYGQLSADNSLERKNKDELYRQVGLFSDTLAIIQTDYADETKPKDLIYGALEGMLSSLDAHSQFLDPDSYNDLKTETEGKFGGIGIEITIKDGLLTVITPVEDTPAWKAGIKPGDKIIKINGQLSRDMNLTEAVKKLRGKPGEAVSLVILRELDKKILEFKVTRDIITIKDIKEAKILEDGIGYIRLIEFRDDTASDFDDALNKLSKEGMNAFILDLRNNPGGLLDSAVNVTGKFLEKGKLVVYTKGRKSTQDLEFLSRSSNPILDIPMVILINEGSASGSEIVAGALQDYKRAIILGVKSFGKGSVQTVIPLSDGSALKLTTSKYYTPSGKVIHEKGVIPDITVEDGKIELGKSNGIKNNTRDLIDEIEKKPAPEGETEFNYRTDNQLARAVDVLKGIKVYGTKK